MRKILSDNETKQEKTKLLEFLNEHHVNWWKKLANKLNKEEIKLLQAEIQKGLELAIEEKENATKQKEELAVRGRLSTCPKIQANKIRKDRERDNKYSLLLL